MDYSTENVGAGMVLRAPVGPRASGGVAAGL
jgi:hypothetical protein